VTACGEHSLFVYVSVTRIGTGVRRLHTLLLIGVALTAGIVHAEPIADFSGSAGTRTEAFVPAGPWLVHWSTRSDNDLPKIFELRLRDADSGALLGVITQLRDTGAGRKLFEEAGRYRFEVVAEHLDWRLTVTGVAADEAAWIRRRSEGRETVQDTTQRHARQVSENNFVSWRPLDDRTLLLFAADESHGYRVTFASSCPGLSAATALTFISAGYGSGGELYDGIMLDDGTHCAFDRVIPTIFD